MTNDAGTAGAKERWRRVSEDIAGNCGITDEKTTYEVAKALLIAWDNGRHTAREREKALEKENAALKRHREQVEAAHRRADLDAETAEDERDEWKARWSRELNALGERERELESLRATSAALQQETKQLKADLLEAATDTAKALEEAWDKLDELRAQLTAAETALGNVGRVEAWLKEDSGRYIDGDCLEWAAFDVSVPGRIATAETLVGLGEKLP